MGVKNAIKNSPSTLLRIAHKLLALMTITVVKQSNTWLKLVRVGMIHPAVKSGEPSTWLRFLRSKVYRLVSSLAQTKFIGSWGFHATAFERICNTTCRTTHGGG